ncbi:RepB family plasmid replication initiator protein [Vibrio cholerae]|uniref:replication initiation protein n=1 Tax=Vibrio cholerae TaxID=666 RepID=UPI000BA8DBD4|nr:replication initiation protein [Vibrio cholerae]EGQ9577887.1 replication initiation protein [Vibrio cholerae]EGR5010058.1 RepB family plasmid replication initiator protein [Vibrio cholerae]EID7714264.1 replication initiation protein [Vibrio cholerae]EJF7196002.1 replication initiation protein [Vibrio cholerae]EJL6682581.1 replication initiation protein [Vibrio cholerae]
MTTSKKNNHASVAKIELPVKTEFELSSVQRYEGKQVMLPPYVNLKNELVFADYGLSAPASRLLYFTMAHFDSDEFYTDGQVYQLNGKFSQVKPSLYANLYKESTSRTIIIPATVLMSVIRGNKSAGQSKNYQPLYDTISQLNGATITINTSKNGKATAKTFRFFDKVEVFKLKRDSDSEQIFVMLTFSVKYMPFVIACSGFTKLSFETMTGLTTVYAMRYYHWCHYALKRAETGRFSITIKELRKRFKFDDGMYQSHFDDRFIQKPINDIMANSALEIYVDELQRKSKTQRRAKIEVASFNISVIPEEILLSQ